MMEHIVLIKLCDIFVNEGLNRVFKFCFLCLTHSNTRVLSQEKKIASERPEAEGGSRSRREREGACDRDW